MRALNLFIAAFLTLLVCSSCREIVILETLTPQQKIKLLLNNQLRESIVKYPHFNHKQYMCMVSIPEILSIQLERKKAISLPITIDHQFSEALKAKQANKKNKKEVYRMVTRRLAALEGHCAYYTTDKFIWEYCHGYSVRQFDDEATHVTALKKNMEDFNLGVYHLDTFKKDATNLESIMEAKQHNEDVGIVDKKIIVPERLIINHETSQWKIQDYTTKRILRTHQNLIQLYPALNSRKMLKTNSKVVKLRCVNSSQYLYGFALSPYVLVTTERVSCGIQPVKIIKARATVHGNKKLKLLRDYLYGDYFEACTLPKAGILKEGMTVILQLILENGRYETQLTVRTILKVDPYYLQMNQTVGVTFQNTLYGLNAADTVYGIKFCVISDLMQYVKPSYSLKYLGGSLAEINSFESIKRIENMQGRRIEHYCLSKFCKNIYEKYEIVVEKKVKNGSYKLRILRQDGRKAGADDEFILKNCWKSHQFQASTLVAPSQEVKSESEMLFTTVRIEDKGRVSYTFEDSSYHIVHIPQNGLLKLHSYSIATGVNYTYLLSRMEPIVKMVEGSPPIFEDAFYVNHTVLASQLSHQIHILQIHQASGYFNAIWRYNDSFILPRMNARDQVFVGYQAVRGLSTVNNINITMIQPDAQINQYVKWLKSYSLLQVGSEQQVDQWEDLPLEKVGTFVDGNSFLLNYSYKDGSVCGNPVNKPRDTIAHLSCGSTWLKLVAFLEKSPCSYELYVQTKLLCEGGYYSTNKEPKKSISEDMVCFPRENWE